MNIYLDMDGVLVDFYRGAHEWMGVEVQGFPYKTGWNWPQELGFDFSRAPVEFWENLPQCDDAWFWVKKACTAANIDHPVICTTPCSEESVIGKQRWLQRHSEFKCNGVIFIKDKSLLARRDALLVDDSTKQARNFLRRGGNILFVDRPWNNRIGL